jgi:3-oxoacyl-[acyl-carrier protein] reductase
MELGLKGKSALVTAASRGFGLEVALQLAAEGVRVALCARGEEDLQAAAAAVRDAGKGPVIDRALDVTDDAAMAGFVSDIEQEWGGIDLLLVNAGGPPAGTFFELDLDQWETAYRLTIESAVRMCRLVMPGMMDRGWGRIVQITSVSVMEPVENLALSSILRPAVQGLTRNLALEGAARGVTVNSVAPGFHTTSAVERLITRKIEQTGCTREDVIGAWTKEIPLGRLGEPEELASLILFLMSARAGYVTGQCIVSDGGWVKGTF